METDGAKSVVKFKKNISTFSLTMTGLTTIIGSGWLLGTQKIAAVAGPAGLISWVLGAVVALMVALFYIEIGSCFPSSGGIGYYSHRTHGRLCGFLTSWINWLSIVAVPAIEAQAVVQYLSDLNPMFKTMYNLSTHSLTFPDGILFAILLMLFFMFVNYWSVKIFIRFNNFFTILKIIVPIITIVVLFASGIHHENFGSSMATFMPNGWTSIFTSVVTAGVVMSFNGFQSPLTFSEEIKAPKKMLPIAVISSILISLVIYFLLQYVFIGAIDPKSLANGWSAINFRSPYVQLMMLANLQLMVTVIYLSSFVSPAVTGVAFLASSSRIMFSLSKEKHLPQFISRLHPLYHNPRNSIILCTLIGCLFILVFKGWYELVAVISVIHLFSYVPAPIITIANRIKNKDLLNKSEQFMLPCAQIFAPLLLFVLSTLLFFAAWPLTVELLILVVPGLLFYAYYEIRLYRARDFCKMFKGASWILLYLVGIALISYLGNNQHASVNFLSMGESILSLALLSLFVFIYGAYFTYTKED